MVGVGPRFDGRAAETARVVAQHVMAGCQRGELVVPLAAVDQETVQHADGPAASRLLDVQAGVGDIDLARGGSHGVVLDDRVHQRAAFTSRAGTAPTNTGGA